jgi:Flp pilus assembly protein TadD
MLTVGQRLLGESGKKPIGVAVLELAVERSPGSYRAREALGGAYEQVGDHERARMAYREAARLSPSLARTAQKYLAAHGG